MRNLVTQSFFARQIGVGRSAVCLAIRAGRLDRSVVLVGKRQMVDYDEALYEWQEHTDPDQSERARHRRKGEA
jgi:hypothetical protein